MLDLVAEHARQLGFRLQFLEQVDAVDIGKTEIEEGDRASALGDPAVAKLAYEEAERLIAEARVVNAIRHRGIVDIFSFAARAGSQIVAEVNARRLDSPLDSVLKLTDARGRQLAFNDDHEDPSDALSTHHADSLIKVTLPADGTCFIRLGDAQNRGGPEYAYRLRISAPRPDFALRVVPSSVNARSGRLVPLTVFALRKDGFDGPIKLSFQDLPEGLESPGATLAAKQEVVGLTVKTSLLDTFWVSLAAILITFLATIYPSRQAARLDPAEGLRYE